MRKLYLVVGFMVFVVFAFFGIDRFTREFFSNTSRTLKLISDIENYEYHVNNEILRSASFLYYSYDKIYRILDKEEKLIEELIHIAGKDPVYSETLYLLKESFLKKKKAVEDFETLNSVIKNSLIYIPALSLRYAEEFSNYNEDYMLLLHSVESYVLMINRSFDDSFIDDLSLIQKRLEGFKFKDPRKNELNRVLIQHLSVFTKHYPEYQDTFLFIIEENEILKLLGKFESQFLAKAEGKRDIISYAHTGFSVLFVGSFIYIAYLIISIQRHRLILAELNKKLEDSLVIDELTKLPNRRAFQRDLANIESACLMLVNIDGFKRVNDLYGSLFGDKLLVEVGKFLSMWIEKHGLEGKVYHFGADDFGVLLRDTSESHVLSLAQELVEEIESYVFVIEGVNISVNVSVGIACEKPLLEKADIAMKHVKNRRDKIASFKEEMREDTEKNLRLINTLKNALSEDRVVLHYQKVVNTFTGEVLYYECLVRIRDEKGRLIYPAQFLQAAKESKFYGRLTQSVIRKAFEFFEDKDFAFSINISAEDITDRSVEEFIYKFLEDNRHMTHRLIFEILESESVENYEPLSLFIDRVRSLGVKVAIDDFGSGYSNFSHIANLSPDYLKIDGSLIKLAPRSDKTRAVVSSIVDFSHKLGVKAIAEFVSDQEIYEQVRALGIEYSQGFYVSEPSEDLT